MNQLLRDLCKGRQCFVQEEWQCMAWVGISWQGDWGGQSHIREDRRTDDAVLWPRTLSCGLSRCIKRTTGYRSWIQRLSKDEEGCSFRMDGWMQRLTLPWWGHQAWNWLARSVWDKPNARRNAGARPMIPLSMRFMGLSSSIHVCRSILHVITASPSPLQHYIVHYCTITFGTAWPSKCMDAP